MAGASLLEHGYNVRSTGTRCVPIWFLYRLPLIFNRDFSGNNASLMRVDQVDTLGACRRRIGGEFTEFAASVCKVE